MMTHLQKTLEVVAGNQQDVKEQWETCRIVQTWWALFLMSLPLQSLRTASGISCSCAGKLVTKSKRRQKRAPPFTYHPLFCRRSLWSSIMYVACCWNTDNGALLFGSLGGPSDPFKVCMYMCRPHSLSIYKMATSIELLPCPMLCMASCPSMDLSLLLLRPSSLGHTKGSFRASVPRRPSQGS